MDKLLSWAVCSNRGTDPWRTLQSHTAAIQNNPSATGVRLLDLTCPCFYTAFPWSYLPTVGMYLSPSYVFFMLSTQDFVAQRHQQNNNWFQVSSPYTAVDVLINDLLKTDYKWKVLEIYKFSKQIIFICSDINWMKSRFWRSPIAVKNRTKYPKWCSKILSVHFYIEVNRLK